MIDVFDREEACFFGMSTSPLYDKYVSEVVTPGVCYLQIPFLSDKKLDLPETFVNTEISGVRMLTMEDAPRVLQRYEDTLRVELQAPSDLDRFVALPEGENFSKTRKPELTLDSWSFSLYYAGHDLVLRAKGP